LAATWLNIVYGFGGMRSDGEKLVFNPSIPKNWTSYSFNILYRGTRLNIKISRRSVVFKACTGLEIAVKVFGREYTADSEGIELEMPAERLE
jgi:maltose phosphorylase